ncbi:MAG TPA: thioredoxin [Gemmatimonadales bacterium]|nr:thioredoxin [Gemmatimonadales bacterium]
MANVTMSCPFCDTLNRVDLGRLGDGPKCAGCGRPLLLDRPQAIPGEALDSIIAGADVPLLIDFYADWCGPCRMMAPVLGEFARDRAGEVLVGKVDTDRDPDAAVRFKVRGIPTLILFSGGREVARQVGVVSRSGLDTLLESAGGALEPSTPSGSR